MMLVSLCFATFTAGSGTYCQSGYKAKTSDPLVCELDAAAIYPYKIVADTVPKGAGLMYRCPVSITFDADALASGSMRGGVRVFPIDANYPTNVYGTHCRVCPPGTAPVLDEAESQAASLRGTISTLTAGGAPDLAGAIYTFRPVAVTCRRVKTAVGNCDYYGADGNCAACKADHWLNKEGTACTAVAENQVLPKHCLRAAAAVTAEDPLTTIYTCAICEYRYYPSADGTTCSPIPACDASDLSSTTDQSIRNKCTDCAKDYFYFQEDPADFASQCVRSCPTGYIFSCMTCKPEIDDCIEYNSEICDKLHCKKCGNGFHLTTDTLSCTKCPEGCSKCDSADNCTKCEDGYGFLVFNADNQHTCQSCIANCLACPDADTTTCSEDRCANGYFSYETAENSGEYLCDVAGKDCSALADASTCHCGRRIENCDICATANVDKIVGADDIIKVNSVFCARCKVGFNATKEGDRCYACGVKHCLECQVVAADIAGGSKSCLKDAHTEQEITYWQALPANSAAPRKVPAYFHSCAPGYAWLQATAADATAKLAESGDFDHTEGATQPWNCRKVEKPARCVELDASDRCIVCEHGFFVKPDGSCAWLHRCPNVVVGEDGKVRCDYENADADKKVAEKCQGMRMNNGFCMTFYWCEDYNEESDMLCIEEDYIDDIYQNTFIKDGIVRPCYEGCETCVTHPGDDLMLGMFSKCATCDQHDTPGIDLVAEPQKLAFYVGSDGLCKPASTTADFCTLVSTLENAVITCIACEAGFYLSANADTTVTCEPCPENCTACSAADTCTVVDATSECYLKDGKVVTCEETYGNCTKCDTTQCLATPKGIFCDFIDPKHGYCQPYGDQFCVEPTESTENQPTNPVEGILYNQKCARCAPGHYLEDNRCPLCVAKYGAMCAECDATRCTHCLGGLTMAPLVDGTSLPSTLTQCISCQERFGVNCMACDDLQCVRCSSSRIYDYTAQKCETSKAPVECGTGCLRCEVNSFESSPAVRCLQCSQGRIVKTGSHLCQDPPASTDASYQAACLEMDYAGNCVRCLDRHSYAVKATAGESVLKTCVHCPSNYGCFVDNEGILWEYTVDGVKGDQVTQKPPPVTP